jgi:hypothetical protein
MIDLCSAEQPDNTCRQCILYKGHVGPHQSFVAEWSEGDLKARRRNAPSAVKKTTKLQPDALPRHSNSAYQRRRPATDRWRIVIQPGL